MKPPSEITPITFNPFKHHKKFIQKTIKDSSISENQFMEMLDCIGNNYIDIYTGGLSPGQISSEIIKILKVNYVFDIPDFENWILQDSDYQMVQLSDHSLWTVRKGTTIEKYIHIHPAKTGPFSLRVKAATLKTIYILKRKEPGLIQPDLSLINSTREKINLPPVKKLQKGKGILRCSEEFL